MRPAVERLPLALVVAVGLWPASAGRAAEGAGITTRVDRDQVTLEDQIQLTITVTGSQRATPDLPDLDAFDVYSRGQATEMRFINGVASASIRFNYILVPKSTGRFVVGPASVTIDGQTYESRPFTLSVLDAAAQPRESRDYFISASASTEQPYVGQQVVYTWRFYRRVRVNDARLEPQEFDGFLVEDLGEVREYQTTVNGVQYLVSEIKKALFPQRTGSLTVPVSQLNLQVVTRQPRRRRSLFDDVFGGGTVETKIVRSAPIPLEVRPLPAPPAGHSGLVGQFDIEAKLSQSAVRVGESASLDLSISGTGNVQMIAEPELPELPQFKVYDDKPRSSIDRGGAAISGSKSYRKALVPLVEGDHSIPSLTLVYFDPEAGSYQTATTEALQLGVTAAENQEELRLTEFVAPTTGKVAVRILADDILPLHKGMEALERSPLGSRPLTGGLLAPPVIFLALGLVIARRRRFASDHGLRRRLAARKAFARGLAEAVSDADGERELSRELSRVFRTYVGDKLTLAGGALTPAEADAALESAGATDDSTAASRDLLERLEAAQYGATRLDREALIDEVTALVDRLEREVGR